MNRFINYLAATVIVCQFNCNAHADKLPSAKTLFERHVEVSYGKDGLKKHTSMTTELGIKMEQLGITIEAINYVKAPGLFYTEGGGFGMMSYSGCDMKHCWEQGVDGETEIVSGKELSRWLQEHDYYRWQNMDKYAKSMETVGIVKWNDEDAYKVKIIDDFDKESLFYFSKERGFMIGNELTVADLDGFYPRSNTYSEFTQYGPFTLPRVSVQEQPTMTRTRTIKSVSFEEIPDSFFEFPDNIKQLISRE